MSIKTYREAINEALLQEMKKDENVVVIGEDVAGGAGTNGEQDAWGGVLGVTKGLLKHFGRERIIDTPITETAIMGMASGAALTGLRPVAELMFVDFMGVCFDQILNQTAKFRYMFGGKAVTPLTIRTMYGGGLRAASQHSQCLYPMFTHVPGIKVVLPSNPYDAKGLLIQSIRDNDPVIFMEHKNLYDTSGDVPDESYSIPFGEANFTREGKDVYCQVPVDMASAALGGSFEVPTIDGGRLKINYDPGTQSGKRFRLRGKGMPGLRGTSRGDAYVETLVETPVNLNKRQKELLKEFSSEGKSKGPQTDSFSEKLKRFWKRD